MARLIVEKGHEKGTSVPLPAKATTVFGRDTTANVQIKDTMASRLHFKIEPRDDGLWIVELQSMNGTLLNGHPVKEAKLNPGDLIRVGETTYSFLAEDAGTDPLIGQRLGGYKLLERVGRGGMGTVYKAEQVDLQRVVALKIISEEHLKNPEFIELFVHEARAAAKLNHPNIVQVYDVKKSNELYFFSMEFVPGGSVQDLLNSKRKVPIPETVRMILEAARGLEYAHRKEIIHRDVKPDNFMIGEGGTVKIGDLGLAQRLGEKLSADNEDTVIGTPHYIAPEQVLGRPADIRSDVYSLGSTMYRMIAGFTPFQAPSIRDLVNKKAREEAIPLHSALAGVPESLGKIVEKMMARLPENRTQSMSDVIAELEAWTRASSGDGVETREAPPVHRKLLVTAVGLLTVLVVGGVIAATTMLKKSPPEEKPADSRPVDGEDPGAAEAKFDRAAAEERGLVDAKPEEFEGVIGLYEAIVNRWPGTPYAGDAQRRMEALRQRRVGLMAARGLEKLDQADRESWAGLLQAFQAGREDLSDAEKRRREYRSFADDPGWKGTEAAGTAGRRADSIAAWMAEVGKRKEAYEALRQKSEALMAEDKFREAWESCNEFISGIAAHPSASKDRYTTLLYDLPSRRLQEQIVDRANKAFQEASAKAGALEAKGDYSQAVQLLEAAVKNSLKDPVDRARKQMEEIQLRWTAANKLAHERAAEEQRKLADLDRRDFDAAARRWHESILRFDPASALAEAQGLVRTSPDKFPRLPAAEARVAVRAAAIKILADFKEHLVRSLNDKPVAIPNRISIERQTGTIVKATDATLTIDLGGGRQIDHTFEGLLAGSAGSSKAAQFLDYLRAAGKNGGPRWSMGLAILELELGLYERAVEDIKAVEKGTDDASRKFVAEFKLPAEDLRYADSDEVEALKHLDRLQVALKESTPRYDIARTLQVLRTRFGDTEVVAAQKTRLDEIEKERGDREQREKEKVARAERHKRITAAQLKAQGEAKSREDAILKGLATLRDPIERAFHLGEAQFGYGNPGSNKTLVEGLEQAFRKFPPPERRNPPDANMIWAARLGSALMRNLHLQKNERGLADIRSKIDAKYDVEFGPWTSYKTAHEQWSGQVAERIKKHGDKLALLEKEFQENPDPKILYDLAEAHDVLRNTTEARGLYAALLSEFPEHERSRSAETQLRFAEMTYQLRDVVKAEELYQKFKTDFPAHPKVAQASPFDPTSIENRIRSCTALKNNMGLSK